MSGGSSVVEYVQTTWSTQEPSVVVEQIGQGKRLPTEALGLSSNIAYRNQVVQAGAVDKILRFLIKTDQPIQDLLPPKNTTTNNNDDDDDSVIPCPSIWLNVLNNFCQDEFVQPKSLARDIQYKICINLGPLFQDMNNFEQHELFQSTEYWCKSLMFFCNILYSLLNCEYSRIGDFCMKQQAFGGFLIRVLYLEIAEPKIVSTMKEISEKDTRMPKPDMIGLAQTFAAHAIKTIMMKYGKAMVETLGVTFIRPEHDLTLMTGMMQLLRTNSGEGWYQGGFSTALNIFSFLYDRFERLSGPFGSDSISEELVPICQEYLSKFAPLSRDRYFYENLVTSIITIGGTLITPVIQGKQAPIDYNVAKAINAGLFEYCIDLCDTADSRLAKPIEGLVRTVASTMVLDETRKVMLEKAPSIKARLERIKERHPVLITELMLIEEVLKNPAITNHNTNSTSEENKNEFCQFCHERIPSPESIVKCPFCKSIIYCSMDCQRLNWMLHQMECETLRKTPLAKTEEELHEQGKILFSKHISKLLVQAALKGIRILDCFVVIDMCETTPLLKTYTLEQFAQAYIQDEDAMMLSKSIMEKNQKKGALTVSFAGFTPDGLSASLLSFPPSTAPQTPSVVATKDEMEKWNVAQNDVARSSLAQAGAQLQKNPQLWKINILRTMKP